MLILRLHTTLFQLRLTNVCIRSRQTSPSNYVHFGEPDIKVSHRRERLIFQQYTEIFFYKKTPA